MTPATSPGCTCGDRLRYVTTSLVTGAVLLRYTPIHVEACEDCTRTDSGQ